MSQSSTNIYSSFLEAIVKATAFSYDFVKEHLMVIHDDLFHEYHGSKPEIVALTLSDDEEDEDEEEDEEDEDYSTDEVEAGVKLDDDEEEGDEELDK